MSIRPLLALLLSAAPAAGQTDAAVTAARDWREGRAPEILAELRELLAIPNVASDAEGIRQNAEWIVAAFERRGARMELLDLPDAPGAPPIVYGTLAAPGASRTLALYVHYDGQPVDAARWTATGPWEPALYSAPADAGGERIEWPETGAPVDPAWRVYARSAGDDKAPIVALLAAIDALEAAGVPRRANLVFFFDGEEEAGSPHLAAYVDRHRDRLTADAWLFMDGPSHPTGRPQLYFGVRGIAEMEITVHLGARDLHSGHYGNWAPNAPEALARLLAGMEDASGNVLVEGFYDTTAPLSAAERATIAALPAFEDALARELGIADPEGEGRYAERIALPSLNVRGLASAAVGEDARNVVPSTATASLDLRLVAGNDPDDMRDRIVDHVRRAGWHVVGDAPDRETLLAHGRVARIERGIGYRAVRTPMDGPEARRIAAAARAVSPEEPVLLPTLGGSLPWHVFDDRLDAPIVGVPIANHDNNQHGPDENLRVANLWYGIDLIAKIVGGVGDTAAETDGRPAERRPGEPAGDFPPDASDRTEVAGEYPVPPGHQMNTAPPRAPPAVDPPHSATTK